MVHRIIAILVGNYSISVITLAVDIDSELVQINPNCNRKRRYCQRVGVLLRAELA